MDARSADVDSVARVMNEDPTAPNPDADQHIEPDTDAGMDAGIETGMDAELDAELDAGEPDTIEPDTIEAGAGDVAVFKRAIEAIVLVAQDPVAPDLIAQLLEQPAAAVERWCEELRAEYAAHGRGFELARVAGGYRYQTHPDETPYVERFVLNDQRARLSGAALETLAIIAYKQPISRAQVASIRGVDPDGVIRTLAARGYIDEVGRDDGPGQAVLFGTTQLFLEKLGLDSLDNLPPIAEFIPDADVVEALEHGLRARPQDPTDTPTSGPASVTASLPMSDDAEHVQVVEQEVVLETAISETVIDETVIDETVIDETVTADTERELGSVAEPFEP